MNQLHDDYLWDPKAAPVAEIEDLERRLKPLSARALDLGERNIRIPNQSKPPARPSQWPVRLATWKRLITVTAVAAAALTGIYVAHIYRLSWGEGSPWPVTTSRADGKTETTFLHVDERIVTESNQTATLSAARIGRVTVAPNSAARLIRTQKGRHRIELEYGRLHAKVWAPPNYFGVFHGGARFFDLGCEFDLSVDATGKGILSVASGWVVYRLPYDAEILVPEHYSLAFDDAGAQMPARIDATNDFRRWVEELDAQPRAGAAIDQSSALELAQKIAGAARDEDYFTLHLLLVRHPQLARGPLYARLAAALKVDVDESHRARWVRGDQDAREEWWRLLPRQPKTWWLNWRDAF